MDLRLIFVGAASLFAAMFALAAAGQGSVDSTLTADPAAPANNSNLGAAAAAGPAEPSSASQGTSPSSASSGDALNEIVVTSQRRSQNLLSVPAAVTATTGAELRASGITTITDLQFNTPGLYVDSGVGYTQLYIRGIGNNIFVGADPSVITNIDDVPRIYGSMVDNLVNVDRVEVLKGAQGGLYGRNATGGVVNILTRQPGDTTELDVRASYGTKNTLEVAAYVNLPINDEIAWNVSVQRNSHDDYTKNLLGADPLTAAMFPNGGGPVLATAGVVTPQQTAAFFNSAIDPQSGYGDQNFWAVDSKLKVQLAPDLKVTLDADWSNKQDSLGNNWFLRTPAYVQSYTSALLGAFGVVTALPPGFYKLPGNFQTYNSTPAPDNLNDYGASIKPEWSLPGVDFTNISSYRAQQTFYSQNYATPITTDVPTENNSKWYVYEELRGVSTFSGPFHLLGGATYLKDHINYESTNLLFPPINTVPNPAVVAQTDTFTQSTDDVRNWSVYAQAAYDITSALTLTASGRSIHETNNALFTSPVVSAASIDSSKFLPSATLSYQLEDGGNVYARYAKGFKAGGVNPVVPPSLFPSDFGKIFQGEQVNTYEIGYKNSLLEHTLQVTTAIFYNNYKNLQSTTTGNAAFPQLIEAIVNAGSAYTYGAEAAVTWRVIRPVTVSVNAAYLASKYTSFENSDGAVLSTFNYSGQPLVDAPKWQLGFTEDLDQPLNDKYSLTGNVMTSYTSTVTTVYDSIPGLPNGISPQYWLTNARIGVKTSDERYRVSLYAKNLFNRPYYTFTAAGTFGVDSVWGDPRIFGGEVEVKF
jgi:iron complex outermembrane recepter protein